MDTRHITIENLSLQERDIEAAAHMLKNGGLVVFPTETVYGLGGDGTNPKAAAAIYAAKGRPQDNPLILHIAAPEDAEPYAVTNKTYYKLARQFMPGPLTVILPKKNTVPKEVTGGLDTVALRCPAHPVANALIRAFGKPIAAPSANRSGRPSPTLAAHAAEDLDGRVDMLLDGGEAEVGLESTIVALDGERGVLLRPGAITYDALCCVLQEVTIAPAVTQAMGKDEKPLSPGMKYRHYAPSAALVLLDGTAEAVTAYMERVANYPTVGLLCYDEELERLKGAAAVLSIGSQNDPKAQAHRLFGALRDMDTKKEITTLYAHLPQRDGLGLALYNRLIRAAAHTVKKV